MAFSSESGSKPSPAWELPPLMPNVRPLPCRMKTLIPILAMAAVSIQVQAVESWEPTVNLQPLRCPAEPRRPRPAPGASTSGTVRLTLELTRDGAVSNYWIIEAPAPGQAGRDLVAATISFAQSCRFEIANTDEPRRTSFVHVWQAAATQAPPMPAQPMRTNPVCENYSEAVGAMRFPTEALQQGIEHGDVLVEFTLSPEGLVSSPRIASSSNPVFEAVSLAAVASLRCRGLGRAVQVRVPFSFKLE
jgi:TonB family protein